MMGKRTLTIEKGPSLFGVNLGFVTCRLRLWASSQTLSPFMNGVKGLCDRLAITCQASS